MLRAGCVSSFLLACAGYSGAAAAQPAADLILHNAKVWTVDARLPVAEAVSVRGDRIQRVGSSADVLKDRGPATRVLDLEGALVLPGFIDGHTHFENAADWEFNLSLYSVDDEAELTRRLARTAGRLPKGLWITGGDLGAYAAWDAKRAGKPVAALVPSLQAVDAVTPDHPVLIRRHDYAYFANSKALAFARVDQGVADPRGGAFGRDASGNLNGMLYGRAAERIVQLMPPPTVERKLVGARLALKDLAAAGITSIHDVARVDAATQAQLFHTFVERSFSDLRIFEELKRRRELTVRVYPLLTLADWQALAPLGIAPGKGDEWIRFGGLKAFVDGSWMREPYADNPRSAGGFTFRVLDAATMERDIVAADRAGWDTCVHVLGDKAHGMLLDWFEAAVRQNPARDRRFRLIHSFYPSPADIQRAGKLGMIADITPQQMVEDMESVEKQLGPERARRAFPWRSLADAGVKLSIVSDWPGGYNEQIPTPLAPLENIFMAVTRQSHTGHPPGSFHPEQALTVEEAVRAYTANPAFASREEALKGTLTEGKLADLVVLSKDILRIPPAEILKTQVLYTILGGRVIHEAPPNPRHARNPRASSAGARP